MRAGEVARARRARRLGPHRAAPADLRARPARGGRGPGSRGSGCAGPTRGARSRRGLGLAPEDRKSQALVLDWSQTKNVTPRRPRPLLARRCSTSERSASRPREQLRALNTVPDDPDRVVRLLSGGNQQKVVLARWLLHECRVLLLDEPTRGVDVATKAEIYRIISDLASSGLGVLVVSSELEELVRHLHARSSSCARARSSPRSTEGRHRARAPSPRSRAHRCPRSRRGGRMTHDRAESRSRAEGARVPGVRARDRRRRCCSSPARS